MIPEPLHPAVVHFPIVLVVLLPVVAALAILAIRRGTDPRPAWLPVLGVAGALAATSWLAVQTGQREEDAVERVVAEAAIHEHEESAEVFFPLTVVGLLLASAGLLRDRPGSVMRSVAFAGALGLTIAGYRVGHSGGELVYEHGAASAYVHSSAGTVQSGSQHADDNDRERESHNNP